MIFDQCLQIMMHWRAHRTEEEADSDISLDDLIHAFWGDQGIFPSSTVASELEEDLNDRTLLRMISNGVDQNTINEIFGSPRHLPWNEQLVKLDLLGWEARISPYDTAAVAYEVFENNFREIIEKALEEGFPPKTFRQYNWDDDDRDWFNFRFEKDGVLWSCDCYIRDKTIIITGIDEDIDWTEW